MARPSPCVPCRRRSRPEFLCKICYSNDDEENAYTLPCGHRWHKDCLHGYLTSKIGDAQLQVPPLSWPASRAARMVDLQLRPTRCCCRSSAQRSTRSLQTATWRSTGGSTISMLPLCRPPRPRSPPPSDGTVPCPPVHAEFEGVERPDTLALTFDTLTVERPCRHPQAGGWVRGRGNRADCARDRPGVCGRGAGGALHEIQGPPGNATHPHTAGHTHTTHAHAHTHAHAPPARCNAFHRPQCVPNTNVMGPLPFRAASSKSHDEKIHCHARTLALQWADGCADGCAAGTAVGPEHAGVPAVQISAGALAASICHWPAAAAASRMKWWSPVLLQWLTVDRIRLAGQTAHG